MGKGRKAANKTGEQAKQSGRVKRETLSSIVPELQGEEAPTFDTVPDIERAVAIVGIAHGAAAYAVKNKLSSGKKRRVKQLFDPECDRAISAMRDFLASQHLAPDVRSRRDHDFQSLCRQARALLHDSLDKNAADHDAFVALERELMHILGGVALDTDSWELEGVLRPFAPGQKNLETEKPARRPSVPVTLPEFMEQYCECSYTPSVLTSRKYSIQSAARRNAIVLPPHAGEWKTGKAKRFDPKTLMSKWPEYRRVLPNLPPLKSEPITTST